MGGGRRPACLPLKTKHRTDTGSVRRGEVVELRSSFSRLGITRTAFGSALGLMKTFVCFQQSFSRHGIARASAALLIWLNENVHFHAPFLASAIRVNSIALGLTKWFVRRRFVWHRTKKCAALRFSFPARSVAALFGGVRRAFRTVPDIRRRSRCRRTPLREACRSARLRGRRACNAASVLRDNREPPVASRIRIRRESGE